MGPVLTIAGTVLGTALIKLVADDLREATIWSRKRILSAALAKLPPDVRDRFSEEWEADLLDKPGELARLTWVVGCYFATSEIAAIVQSAIVRSFSRSNFDRMASRAQALIAGVVLAVLIWPVMCLLMVLQRPLGYRFRAHTRIGRDEKPYSQLRFCANQGERRAEDFLRFTELSEVPLILNLLKGEMALVGPRPRTREQFDRLKRDHQEIYKRILPGITSPVVLVGSYRGARDAEDFEFEYFLNRTVISDLCVFWAAYCLVLSEMFARWPSLHGENE